MGDGKRGNKYSRDSPIFVCREMVIHSIFLRCWSLSDWTDPERLFVVNEGLYKGNEGLTWSMVGDMKRFLLLCYPMLLFSFPD